MSEINVYFVRHGQTYLNLYNRIQGWSDAPLTEKGIQDAKNAGQTLKSISFDLAYSSDSPRAINTAKMILEANPTTIDMPTIEPAFREQFFGYFEGADGPHTWDFIGRPLGLNNFEEMIAELSVEKVRDMIAAADQYHHAEDNQQFWDRLNPGFDLLAKQTQAHNILVVSHGTTIRSIVSHFAPGMNPTSSPKNGSITKLTITGKDINVDFFNQLTLPN